jgi:hypothetical protein
MISAQCLCLFYLYNFFYIEDYKCVCLIANSLFYPRLKVILHVYDKILQPPRNITFTAHSLPKGGGLAHNHYVTFCYAIIALAFMFKKKKLHWPFCASSSKFFFPFYLQLFVPRCTGLTADGLVKIIQFLHECKGNLNRVRLHGICKMTKHHLDVINSLICRSSQPDAQALYYNHRVHEVLNTDDSRPIDVDVCPLCRNVRLVFDCTRKDCRSVTPNLRILLSSHSISSLEIPLAVYW